jgi:mannose/fructose/N-acetylgalactosamine-specific phosphotransferase system component IID
MITELIDALSCGKQLANSTEWKNAQLTTNAVTGVAAGLLALMPMAGIHPTISHEQVLAIAGGIAAILGVFNTYTTVATTKTIGLPTGAGDTNTPAADTAAITAAKSESKPDNIMGI